MRIGIEVPLRGLIMIRRQRGNISYASDEPLFFELLGKMGYAERNLHLKE